MSESNEAVVRALFDAWNADDMEGLRALYDPQVVVRPPEGWSDPGPYVGPDAVVGQWRQMREVWDADSVEVVGDVVSSADRVVVRFVWRGVGPEHDDVELTGLWTVRQGLILESEFFWSHAETLETVGLGRRFEE